jgi:hypothetical protein
MTRVFTSAAGGAPQLFPDVRLVAAVLIATIVIGLSAYAIARRFMPRLTWPTGPTIGRRQTAAFREALRIVAETDRLVRELAPALVAPASAFSDALGTATRPTDIAAAERECSNTGAVAATIAKLTIEAASPLETVGVLLGLVEDAARRWLASEAIAGPALRFLDGATVATTRRPNGVLLVVHVGDSSSPSYDARAVVETRLAAELKHVTGVDIDVRIEIRSPSSSSRVPPVRRGLERRAPLPLPTRRRTIARRRTAAFREALRIVDETEGALERLDTALMTPARAFSYALGSVGPDVNPGDMAAAERHWSTVAATAAGIAHRTATATHAVRTVGVLQDLVDAHARSWLAHNAEAGPALHYLGGATLATIPAYDGLLLAVQVGDPSPPPASDAREVVETLLAAELRRFTGVEIAVEIKVGWSSTLLPSGSPSAHGDRAVPVPSCTGAGPEGGH